jgi:hypothetical protein
MDLIRPLRGLEGWRGDMDDQSRRWSTGIRLIVCAGLAGIIALELSSSLPLAPRVTATPPAAPMPEFAPEPAPFEPPPSDAFAEIAARPLFSASRRPFVSEADPGQPLPPTSDEAFAVELVGTLLTAHDRAALLQPEGQDASWFRVGDQISGWHVDGIERDRVTLRLEEDVQTLTLRADMISSMAPITNTEQRSRRPDRESPAQPEQAPESQDEQAAEQQSQEVEQPRQ